jgi:DNA polymerase III alpha subunit
LITLFDCLTHDREDIIKALECMCSDKWKKTMHKRIQETKQFMMKLTDNQLEMTTKRTIMENEQMSAEIAYQSCQTNAVLSQNNMLDTRVAELKQALVLSRDTENELAKRNTVYQSTIKQLVRPPPHCCPCSSGRGMRIVCFPSS